MRDAIIAFLAIGMIVSGCAGTFQNTLLGCKQSPNVYCPPSKGK